MATTSNLSVIIKFYSEKQKSPFIDFKEFCDYIKKYAEHHVEENAELVKYLGNPVATVSAELMGLEEKHIAALVQNGSKRTIICVVYVSLFFAERYREILKNDTVPYPTEADLPKHFPPGIIERKSALSYLMKLTDAPQGKSQGLYILTFDRDMPPVLMPASVTIQMILETAQKKIRRILKKEEYHDYFLKKLRTSNPTKELSIKNFFERFVDFEVNVLRDITDGDDYYLWNQLCYFIRQDFEKIQDRTQEDVSILQAIAFTEIYSTYLKRRFQEDKQRDEALKVLEGTLNRAPFYFSMNQILKFQDESGRLLYGQYSEDDLRDFMQKASTESDGQALPRMVVFKAASGTRYYVMKENVVPLVIRFCNEAHESVKESIIEKWYDLLIDYVKIPEMTEDAKFELCLERQVEEKSPVLYALLNANFMTVIALEKSMQAQEQDLRLFVNGKLLPYSDLLMINRDKLLSETKSRLPFFYTIPILSWIMSLFHSRKKKDDSAKKKKDSSKNAFDGENDDGVSNGAHRSKEAKLADRAKELSLELVPEGSTVDRELNFLCKQWNRMISKEANMNLTEDVNALIRDYSRKVGRTLLGSSLSKERLYSLAQALVRTPNMQKIGEEKNLTEYVALYMLRLFSNSK